MYIIEWRDHFSTDDWFDIKDPKINVEFTLTSLGFYVKSDKNYHHFARTKGEHAYADMMSILKNQVVSIIEIEEE
jgi:hypothetical protein